MSALRLSQSFTAIGVNLTSSFLAVGGTSPYTYSVRPGGPGGTIDSSSGIYTAPPMVSSDPDTIYDVIQARDSLGAIATAQILVGTPLLLFCDILQTELSLPQGRVYLWDQKLFQPTDSGLYIAVSVPLSRPFANVNRHDGSGSGLISQQSVNVMDTLDIDLISRGPDARDRKEEVVLAFLSDYSQSQQEANSFSIGRLPPNSKFINLSSVDGAAIPYRYRITVNMQYAYQKAKPVSYFDTFSGPQVTTNP